MFRSQSAETCCRSPRQAFVGFHKSDTLSVSLHISGSAQNCCMTVWRQMKAVSRLFQIIRPLPAHSVVPRTQPLLDRLLYRVSDLRFTLHQVKDHTIRPLVLHNGQNDFADRLPRLQDSESAMEGMGRGETRTTRPSWGVPNSHFPLVWSSVSPPGRMIVYCSAFRLCKSRSARRLYFISRTGIVIN